MARVLREFQAFTSLVDRLLAVPKETLDRRVAAHKAEAARNPRKRGPKPKGVTPSASRASGRDDG
jgi:hypothetical protein